MEAYIYDHARTPRGRGRADGSLRDISSVELATQVLQALRDRNGLDTALLDDVVLGCAQPVGEQGGNIARAAVLNADYAQSVAGQQVHRFCASGLEAVNNVAAQIMAGQADAGVGGGVESMSRTFLGADSGAWVADPSVAHHNYFTPQGIGADLIATLDGFARTDVDSYAAESQNLVSPEWIAEFDGAVTELAADENVIGVIVTSAKPAFMAGADLKIMAAAFETIGVDEAFEMSRRANEMHRHIELAGKPFLAAINGLALGGGFELALACHYRFITDSPKAIVGLPEVTVGLLAGSGGTQRMPRMIGIHKPSRLEGDRMVAGELYEAHAGRTVGGSRRHGSVHAAQALPRADDGQPVAISEASAAS